MKWLQRLAAVLGIMFVLAVVYAGWMLYGGWPAPDGYEFPRSSLWGGGPTALFDGELVEVDGCIRAGGEDAATVVWPPGYSLTLEGGEPVVHGSFRDMRMGEPVQMGGGWYDGAPPTSRDTEGCPPPYFLSTGFVD